MQKRNLLVQQISLLLDASVGIASNMNAGLYQHMHAFQVQQLSYNHYILGHHNVKFAAAGKQSNNYGGPGGRLSRQLCRVSLQWQSLQ